jgi:two-component system sensor histidine kinase and response regulator WspE
LAGESLVNTRWLEESVRNAARMRHAQRDLADALERFRESLIAERASPDTITRTADLQRKFGDLRRLSTESSAQLDDVQRRAAGVATVLYREVVNLRMRPFGEGVAHLGRMVRSLAKQLGKDVQLEIVGEATPVDRDIMERLDAPIVNLIRNAIDHGIEPPDERLRLGKPATGTVRLQASHRAGMLFIVVEDDGRGVDLDLLRREVVQRKLTTEEAAARLSETELLDFLFLPGFSLKGSVTEISGRGVGLDIVQTTARDAGGKVSVHTRPGNGLQFIFQLPLTLSVIRALLIEVGGEPYAVPITRVGLVLTVSQADIESIEGRQHVAVDGDRIGLIPAQQVLGTADGTPPGDQIHVLVLGHGTNRYGLTVERVLGERELVVRPLDRMLGKVKDVSSAAVLPDRTPVLILDVEDLTHSIEHLISGGRIAPAAAGVDAKVERKTKRILVVDDSFTVRELERKVLRVDGWNAVRTGQYALVVTDVDMPRMDGIELVTTIRQDPRLQLLPIIIVSYKEREEDRLRGLEAGADRYLTKGSYHDESLIHAIVELIGPAEES